MKSGFFAAIGILFAGIGATSNPTPVKGDIGDPIVGLTPSEKEIYAKGRALFVRNWTGRKQGRSNAVACIFCHGEPTMGGFMSNPIHHLLFVPDENDISGFRMVGRAGRNLPADGQIRRSQPVYGLGLLEAVPEATIRKMADPEDKNGDGISGRYLEVGGKLGRYGWKANHPTVQSFTDTAFHAELGLEIGEGTDKNDLTREKSDAVGSMLSLLAPPPLIKYHPKGKAMFSKVGCGGCHTPQLVTGPGRHPSLENRVIEPYTDMLLHDLTNDPQVKSGRASRNEFRTTPLWGLGQVEGSYMHDGTATTLEEAINRHGGEAAASRKKFQALSKADKAEFLRFLNGL